MKQYKVAVSVHKTWCYDCSSGPDKGHIIKVKGLFSGKKIGCDTIVHTLFRGVKTLNKNITYIQNCTHFLMW